MSKKKKASNEFRFALGSPARLQSSIWHLWVHRNEVYLSTSTLGGILKISLHSPLQTGGPSDWRFAFTKTFKLREKPTDRVIGQWFRPEEFRPGFTLGPRILVSPLLPKYPFRDRSTPDTRVTFYEPTFNDQNHKVIFAILITSEQISSLDVQALQEAPVILRQLQKENKERVWLVAIESSLFKHERKSIQKFMRNIAIWKQIGTVRDETYYARGFSFSSEDNPTPLKQPMFWDFSLGYENCHEDRFLAKLIRKIYYKIKAIVTMNKNPLEL